MLRLILCCVNGENNDVKVDFFDSLLELGEGVF